MKHAKKMKLVDVNTPEPINNETNERPTNTKQHAPVNNDTVERTSYDALSFLDRHMKAILDSKDLNDFDKWTQYNEALTRYLYWFKEKNSENNTLKSNLKKIFTVLNSQGENKQSGNTLFDENVSSADDSDDYERTTKRKRNKIRKRSNAQRVPYHRQVLSEQSKRGVLNKKKAELIFKNWDTTQKA